MKRILQSTLTVACFLGLILNVHNVLAADAASFTSAVNGDHRSEANKGRDQYRHPAETLAFFGVEPGMTVIESWPGGGWYTEVLAPYLREEGMLIGAQPRKNERWEAMLDGNPSVYSKVVRVDLGAGEAMAEAGTVDAIVDFRNAHNWMRRPEVASSLLKSWNTVLKPGGVVGITDHRQGENPIAGYIKERDLVDIMSENGFEFVATSDVNANPKDTKDYEGGVWTLPPVLRNGDQDRAKYMEIGESDRLTMLFRKK